MGPETNGMGVKMGFEEAAGGQLRSAGAAGELTEPLKELKVEFKFQNYFVTPDPGGDCTR